MDDVYVRFNEAGLRQLLESQNGPTAKYLMKVAIRVQTRAKRKCPVDTGRLRSSITHEAGQDSKGLLVRIGTNVHYAPYVEFGTIRMRPQPFLRPALDEVMRSLP
jgi:HK97 gp10 family phage protein